VDAQPQRLGEQLRQALQMRLPKAGDRIVIGVLVRSIPTIIAGP
jgi:hypothetical protein